ncbi:MAG: efflux RND transporter permease subunit, partial [Aurantibacter sp.]
MAKRNRDFWAITARIILRNRIFILLLVGVVTLFLALQWENMRFSNSQANLLPDDHPVNLEYRNFLDQFGEEGNAIVFAVNDSALFNPENFNRWNKLSKQLGAFPEIDFVISTDNLQELIKDDLKDEFVLRPLISSEVRSQEELDSITEHLFQALPFYEDLLYNKETRTIRTVANLDKDIVNTSVRKDFILKDLTNLVKDFEDETGMNVRVSGMPYIRTM